MGNLFIKFKEDMYSDQQPKSYKKVAALGMTVLAGAAIVGTAINYMGPVSDEEVLGLSAQKYRYVGQDYYKFCPWDAVKNNPRGAQNHPANRVWSREIYEAMIKEPKGSMAGQENGGGINHNASYGRLSKASITKTDADWLCGNPCHWYSGKGNKVAEVADMCDCA